MKSYFILDCEKQQKIADNLYGFFLGITAHDKPKGFWNTCTREQVEQYFYSSNESLELRKWFDSMHLKVRDMSYTYWGTDSIHQVETHIDRPPVIAKINFPVLNTKNTYNTWYDEDRNEIDRVECIAPIVLRSDILHGIDMGKNPKIPRLQFSFCFYKEPINYLNPTKEEEQRARETHVKRFKENINEGQLGEI